MSDRLWLYSNYHCNLRCRYCLTESAPGVARRLLGAGDMVESARQARALGFRALGVTGGEPFLLLDLPEVLAELARILPVLVLTNATLFTGRVLARLRPLAELPVDAADLAGQRRARRSTTSSGPRTTSRRSSPRSPGSWTLGIPVRIATTGDRNTPEQMERLCALHRSLGVPDEDHVVRPIVRRGRALDHELGVVAEPKDLFPELTLTADGAFWSPFGPTVHAGRLDTDLLLTRQRLPLDGPARRAARRGRREPRGPRRHAEHPLSVSLRPPGAGGEPFSAVAGAAARARRAGGPPRSAPAVRTVPPSVPLTLDSPPPRRRASTGTSRTRRPARAALTTISSGQPYVRERIRSASRSERRIARSGPRSVTCAPQAARTMRAIARFAAIWWPRTDPGSRRPRAREPRTRSALPASTGPLTASSAPGSSEPSPSRKRSTAAGSAASAPVRHAAP